MKKKKSSIENNSSSSNFSKLFKNAKNIIYIFTLMLGIIYFGLSIKNAFSHINYVLEIINSSLKYYYASLFFCDGWILQKRGYILHLLFLTNTLQYYNKRISRCSYMERMMYGEKIFIYYSCFKCCFFSIFSSGICWFRNGNNCFSAHAW